MAGKRCAARENMQATRKFRERTRKGNAGRKWWQRKLGESWAREPNTFLRWLERKFYGPSGARLMKWRHIRTVRLWPITSYTQLNIYERAKMPTLQTHYSRNGREIVHLILVACLLVCVCVWILWLRDMRHFNGPILRASSTEHGYYYLSALTLVRRQQYFLYCSLSLLHTFPNPCFFVFSFGYHCRSTPLYSNAHGRNALSFTGPLMRLRTTFAEHILGKCQTTFLVIFIFRRFCCWSRLEQPHGSCLRNRSSFGLGSSWYQFFLLCC